MKLSSICLVFFSAAVAAMDVDVDERQISKPGVVTRLLSNARRLADDDGYGDGQLAMEGIEEVESVLMNYQLKLLKCEGEESLGMSDEGVLQYGVAIVRACPARSCSSKTQGGCTVGHADFAVPLGDFVQAYIEDQQENMQWDDAQNLDQYSKCTKYQGNDGNADTVYYVGPACTSNGKGIKLGVFTDEYCQTESKTSFESISNGLTLPYTDGGLVSKQCLSCKEDDGSLKEMCATFYEDAALKCEQWDISHYYWDSITLVYRFGKDKTGCKYIGWMDKSEPFSEWAAIFMLLIMVIGSIIGAAYYTKWWKERKATLEKIDDDASGCSSAYQQHNEEDSSINSAKIDNVGLFDGIFT